MVIVDVPEALKACTLVETVVVPSEIAAVIVLCPATLPPPTNARPGLLEVMVKATPPVGAAGLSVSNKDVCKLLPMVRFAAIMSPPQLTTQAPLVIVKLAVEATPETEAITL